MKAEFERKPMKMSSQRSARSQSSQWKLFLLAFLINNAAFQSSVLGFQTPSSFTSRPTSTSLNVLEMDKVETEIKEKNEKKSTTQSRQTPPNVEILDPSTYEAMLINSWDVNPSTQKGFDWQIEKARRNFAGLQQLDDGSWVKRPSLFDFLVSKSQFSSAEVRRLDEPPKPVGVFDVAVLFATNFLANVGFGPALGMASVPDAVIQKYEGSFFSFIKGVLGGDLQTLAGGPLFLLLAKYYQDYGPIFNLSFGPKSFLVVSDPVMARHILRESKPEQYCKGMLAEILEPIMGKGLIPADPATWKVSE